MVNTQEIQGSWNRIKGQVKEKWGNLTDDDLQIQGGNLDQLIGKIQKKTGESARLDRGLSQQPDLPRRIGCFSGD